MFLVQPQILRLSVAQPCQNLCSYFAGSSKILKKPTKTTIKTQKTLLTEISESFT
jgi:hypothetical protein